MLGKNNQTYRTHPNVQGGRAPKTGERVLSFEHGGSLNENIPHRLGCLNTQSHEVLFGDEVQPCCRQSIIRDGLSVHSLAPLPVCFLLHV